MDVPLDFLPKEQVREYGDIEEAFKQGRIHGKSRGYLLYRDFFVTCRVRQGGESTIPSSAQNAC